MVLKPGVGVGLGVKICVGRLRQREWLYPFYNTCNKWHVKLTSRTLVCCLGNTNPN